MESNFVNANGIRLHYHRCGGPGPAVVLAHGVTDNGLCWWPFIRRIEERYDLVLYDARGHGLSQKPAKGYDIATMADDLVGLVEALELEQPILIGHSMGGATVAMVAARWPELARAVVLEDPVHMHEKPNMDEDFLDAWREKIANRNAMSLDELIEHCRSEVYPGWPEEEYEPWARAKKQVTPKILPVFGSFPRLRNVLPRIGAPTLILRADGGEEQKRKDFEVARLLDNGTLVHVEGAGHNVRRDRPEAAMGYLREFLGI